MTRVAFGELDFLQRNWRTHELTRNAESESSRRFVVSAFPRRIYCLARFPRCAPIDKTPCFASSCILQLSSIPGEFHDQATCHRHDRSTFLADVELDERSGECRTRDCGPAGVEGAGS